MKVTYTMTTTINNGVNNEKSKRIIAKLKYT